jgi:hypothetical protein
MNKPHKHAELIKAWADGAEIEYYEDFYDSWRPVSSPAWIEDIKYRIKPHVEKKFIFAQYFEDAQCVPARIWNEGENKLGIPIIQVTLTNGKVTAVELTK